MINIVRTQDGSETINAQTGSSEGFELKYLISGAESRQSAIAALMQQSPLTERGAIRTQIRWDGTEGDVAAFTVIYAQAGNRTDEGESKESTLNFDCTGSTRKMLYAYDTRIIRGPDPGNAIGWNGMTGSDMEIAGVDVPDGVSRETYSRVIKMSRLTNDYKRLLIKMRGCVNLKPFKGWQKGEAMYIGATFQGVLDSKALITVNYNFQINLDEENVKVGGVNVGNKKGFEYLWAFYRAERAEGESPRRLAPDGVYLSQVARYADFGALGV